MKKSFRIPSPKMPPMTMHPNFSRQNELFAEMLLQPGAACPLTNETNRENLVVQRLRPAVPSDPPLHYLTPFNFVPMERRFARLYEEGFFTFDDDGTFNVSGEMSNEDLDYLVTHADGHNPTFNRIQLTYVRFHSKHVFRNDWASKALAESR